MSESPECFNPFELLKESDDSLSEACERLARILLHGDHPSDGNPFDQLAEKLLSDLLMDWALNGPHTRQAKAVQSRAFAGTQ